MRRCFPKILALLSLFLVLGGCTQNNRISNNMEATLFPSVDMEGIRGGEIILNIHVNTFTTQAQTPKTSANIDHLTYKIFNASDLTTPIKTQLVRGNVVGLKFLNVPPGTYKVSAEAFESTDNTKSITKGGPQLSGNIPVVEDGKQTPHSVTLTLNLLDAVGDNIDVNINLNNGANFPPIGSQPSP